jgi:polyketide cyclase/dehydrase/lipid transport protein
MAKAYYSTVFSQSADDIWTVIRDFNNYTVWVDGAGESHIEGGKSSDAVGAVRNVLYNGKRVRQSLLALSDPDRAMSYAFCDADALPVQHYQATLKLTPITDGNRAFVEWWATFDCTPERHDEWTAFYRDAFGRWLGCGGIWTVGIRPCNRCVVTKTVCL